MTLGHWFDVITLVLFTIAPFFLAWTMLTRTVIWTFLGRSLLGWVLSIGLVFVNTIVWRLSSDYVPPIDGQPEWWRAAVRVTAIVSAVLAVVAVMRSPQSDDPGRVRWSSLFRKDWDDENDTLGLLAAKAIAARDEAVAEKSAASADRNEVSAARHEQATEEQREITTELTETIDRVEKKQAEGHEDNA